MGIDGLAAQGEMLAAISTARPQGITNEPLGRVKERAELHLETWSDKPELYWLGRLIQEVSELALALTDHGEHTGHKVDSPDDELVEIASIAINWLRHRQDC